MAELVLCVMMSVIVKLVLDLRTAFPKQVKVGVVGIATPGPVQAQPITMFGEPMHPTGKCGTTKLVFYSPLVPDPDKLPRCDTTSPSRVGLELSRRP